ncbi:MAG: tRNA pseudouridine(55) synthase TruB [Deltaproteobacteria bacterium]|nr:tRNA pseudouridine(55) synthase TruB [Deltaproteobacteria bacterium]MBW2070780.1 tRNA pseudouridine(55) synthase TruB [Deltaproteobacteria bacterium]
MSTSLQISHQVRTAMRNRFVHDGVLLLNKHPGCTSHDLVVQARRLLGGAKVGHAGTLDPFASGLLVLLVNEATKLSPFLTSQEKEYLFTVFFGIETDTQDCTGKVIKEEQCAAIAAEEIRRACTVFTGLIDQVVPRYSAVRLGGRRLYQLAYQGQKPELPVRTVRIDSLSLVEVKWPEATFRVVCSKGTYVRALASDLARYLHCGGHVSRLCRLRSGGFRLERSITLAELASLAAEQRVTEALIPLSQAVEDYPALAVSELTARRIRQGMLLTAAMIEHRQECGHEGRTPFKVVDPRGQLVAIVARCNGHSQRSSEAAFKTLRVFGTSQRSAASQGSPLTE